MFCLSISYAIPPHFISNNHIIDAPFALIHYDVRGSFHEKTYEGHCYFLTIVNDFSKFTWLKLMQHKSEAGILIEQFFAYVETQFSVTIKAIHTDNDKELALHDFLTSKGVLHQSFCVERP